MEKQRGAAVKPMSGVLEGGDNKRNRPSAIVLSRGCESRDLTVSLIHVSTEYTENCIFKPFA